MNKHDEGLTILDIRVQLNKREKKSRVILALYCYIVTKYFNVVKTSKSEMTDGKEGHKFSCEISRFYAKKIIFFPILGGAPANITVLNYSSCCSLFKNGMSSFSIYR